MKVNTKQKQIIKGEYKVIKRVMIIKPLLNKQVNLIKI